MSESSRPVCGVLFSNFHASPHDETGCTLANGHEGPHQFKGDDGVKYAWETDWECDCPECSKGDPADWCSIYWRI